MKLINWKYPVLFLNFLSFLLSGCTCGNSGDKNSISGTYRAQHVILFIADGMHLEHEIAASRYLYGTDSGLIFHSWGNSASGYCGPVTTWNINSYNYRADIAGAGHFNPNNFISEYGYDPERGGAFPYPLSEPVETNPEYFLGPPVSATDSAAAATAIACGIKTDAGNISWTSADPAYWTMQTIAEKARLQRGYKIGIISTVPFSHATPAAFVSHNISRDNLSPASFTPGFTGTTIAEEIIRTAAPDVVIGGGHHLFDIEKYITSALYDEIRTSAEYVFVERTAGTDGGDALSAASINAADHNKKLFGLFGGTGGNFEYPVPSDAPGNPSISAGNIENPWLGDCVTAALMVLDDDSEGFFVMFEQGTIDWSNHANNYHNMIGCIYELDQAVKSAVDYIDRPDDSLTWENTLIIVTADHSNSYMRLAANVRTGTGDLPVMEGADYSHTYPGEELTYGTTQHTNEPVMVYALGSGAGLFNQYQGLWYPGTTLIDNTNIYDVMAEVMEIK